MVTDTTAVNRETRVLFAAALVALFFFASGLALFGTASKPVMAAMTSGVALLTFSFLTRATSSRSQFAGYIGTGLLLGGGGLMITQQAAQARFGLALFWAGLGLILMGAIRETRDRRRRRRAL